MPEFDAVTDRILWLIRSSLLLDHPSIDTDLVEAGMIDSAGFMELFVVLENEFEIEIKMDDLDLDNFRTVERMAGFVIYKQNEGDDQ